VSEQRVILTDSDVPVAVADSPERFETSVRQLQLAAHAVLDWAASRVSMQGEPMGFDELCRRANVDPANVTALLHDSPAEGMRFH
jgi:hypothetical protein